MNPLPQRKKSPEEIARLRESLGIRPLPIAPGSNEDEWPDPPPPQQPAAPSPEMPPGNPELLDEAPPQVRARHRIHSFKRSEYTPQPQDGHLHEVALTEMERAVPPQPAVIPVAAHSEQQSIRSLRRSESVPAPAAMPPATDGKLPARRHSDEELAQARRNDALAVMAQGNYQLPKAAHPVLLAIGYVLAIGGAAAPALLDGLSLLTGSYALATAWGGGYHILTSFTLAALPVAAFIYLEKSLSRHHAAFIAIIGFFALVFAVLHYFPQLRHAT